MYRPWVLAVFVTLSSGCEKHVPYELSQADQKRFAAVVRVPASDPAAASKIYGLSDCTVYKAITARERITDWRVVVRSDYGGSYPKFLTVCTRESLKWDGKYLNAFLCAQAIGAGGGCANGGDFRSRDGEHRWQIGRGNSWVNL